MRINKIRLFANDNTLSNEIKNILSNKLKENNFIISDDDYELGIAIGGDGSFLRMLKQSNFNSDVYYIGINTGTLGFLQEIKPDNIDDFILNLKNNNYKIEEIGIQKTKINSNNISSIFYSLNEIVVRNKELNTIFLNIFIDDILLEKFIGDGILVSTSVGSTAYNLSFGGSIVYNTLHTLEITPIAPLNNKSYRNLLNSIIIPEDKTIKLLPSNSKDIIITVDGENNIYEDVSSIETTVSDKKIKCLRMNNYNSG